MNHTLFGSEQDSRTLKYIRPLTYVLSLGGIALCMAISVKLGREGKSTSEIISAVGSVASFFGLIIAILQIKSVREMSAATQHAIAETRIRLIVNISISDLAKAVKLIEQIQIYAGYGKYDLAHMRLQDLRLLLLQFGGNERFLTTTGRESYENLLLNIGIHLVNLYDAVVRNKTIRITILNQTLEKAVSVLVAFENELKFEGGVK